MDVDSLDIRECLENELPVIEANLSSRFHQLRFDAQKNGEGIYLIAWYGDIPVGNLLVRWYGSTNKYIRDHGVLMPYLEALLVKPEFRRRGVGQRLIEKAEGLVKEKGYSQVGLAVGIENEAAKRLYTKLGYQAYSQLDKFLVTRIFKNPAGLQVEEREWCIYLSKQI